MILEDQKKIDNTVGSRSKIDLAYIAGFLDGDGSVMLQIKRRSDGRNKLRFMVTICFYQDTRHDRNLYWIRKILSIGYISKRKDGMTELRINGYSQVKNILKALAPYTKFKKLQCRALLKACEILSKIKYKELSQRHLKTIVDYILIIQSENYVTKRKKTKGELFEILGLTP